MQELTVKYKNELNTIPMRKFSAKEMDLFFSICAKMKNKNCDTVRFEFSDLKELSNYYSRSEKRFVTDLQGVYQKMLGLTYREEDEEEIRYFVLFQGFVINKKHQYVEISVNPKLDYILNQLTNEFTQFELKEFTDLKSSYSKTMYRLLKQFKSTGYYTVKVEEFRELLDVPQSYRMTDINRQILTPIQKELSKYFDPFKIKKVKAKKGNRIDRLEFLFQEKQYEEELPNIPMYNWLADKN